MAALSIHDPGATRRWAGAAALALVGHALALGAVLLWVQPSETPEPDPVVLLELPEGASAPSAAAPALSAAQAPAVAEPERVQHSRAEPAERIVRPQPLPDTPSPREPQPMALPAPAVSAAQSASVAQAAPVVAPAPPAPPRSTSAGGGKAGSGPGTSPKARKAQQDYFAMVAAHLQRKKSYPKEAKKARQEGIVTVRFTVARDGSVSAIAIKRSSGHELLDGATLDLLRRVAPLPKMPDSMERESVTLSLPIDYSLRTD